MDALTSAERALFQKLKTPEKIQDFLDELPINHEKGGETCYSPRLVMEHRKIHCLEGALFGAAVLAFHGRPALLMNFYTAPGDEDHAVALFKENGYWGALSKTNHAVLRYRDPVYKTLRELALSYFHEYFSFEYGIKTLRAYSKPFRLPRSYAWVTHDGELWDFAYQLRASNHFPLIPEINKRRIRPATSFERSSLDRIEWEKSDPRT